jgi:hypothetical protein
MQQEEKHMTHHQHNAATQHKVTRSLLPRWALASLTSVALVGCNGNFGNEPAAEQTAAPAPAATTAPVAADPDVEATAPSLSAIDDDPQAYLGQTVSVRGDVIELVGQHAFRVSDPALLGGDDLLVVQPNPEVVVGENDTVAVTGVVREFDLTAIEQEASLDLRDELFGDLAGEPVIVAETVATTPGTAMRLADIGAIAEDPAAFADETLLVPAAIAEQVGPADGDVALGGFTVTDPALLDDGELLVLGANGQALADLDPAWFDGSVENAQVLISGTIRTFVVQELETDYDFNLQDPVYAGYENQPVLMAERVLPVIGLGELTANPNAYQGRTIAVNGNMSERVAQRFFRLNEDEPLQGDDLLVFNAIGLPNNANGTATAVVGADQAADATTAAPGAGAPLDDDNGTSDIFEPGQNEGLWVIGTVRAFAIADIEQEYGLDLDDEPFADDQAKPVIVASDIVPMQP